MEVRPIDGNVLIEWFRPYLHTGEAIPADVVIEDIRSMPTLTPPNEPLTLGQLREMDGEPVWFDTIKRWGIVKVNREGIFVVTKSGEYEFGRCKVYRRPPEGEEDI